MKCPICSSKEISLRKEEYRAPFKRSNGEDIIVKDVSVSECDDCGESWMSSAEWKKVEGAVERARYEVLTPGQIREFRESLPFKTKKELASFLCLNEKAFVKWEKGYSEPNRAYDLLLRLAARSRENFEFIKNLHDKHFKFDKKDYHFLREIEVTPTFDAECFFVNEAKAVKTTTGFVSLSELAKSEAGEEYHDEFAGAA